MSEGINGGGSSNNVLLMFDADRDIGPRPPSVTHAEVAEYRELLPQMRQMLKEWQSVKGSNGCPVARSLLEKE